MSEQKPDLEELKNTPIPTRRAKMLMVNPADFMVLFTKGLVFAKRTEILTGVPKDATLLTIAAEPARGGVMLVVESEEYDEIPINELPPVQLVEINTGVRGATKKKKQPRKK